MFSTRERWICRKSSFLEKCHNHVDYIYTILECVLKFIHFLSYSPSSEARCARLATGQQYFSLFFCIAIAMHVLRVNTFFSSGCLSAIHKHDTLNVKANRKHVWNRMRLYRITSARWQFLCCTPTFPTKNLCRPLRRLSFDTLRLLASIWWMVMQDGKIHKT